MRCKQKQKNQFDSYEMFSGSNFIKQQNMMTKTTIHIVQIVYYHSFKTIYKLNNIKYIVSKTCHIEYY